MEKPKDIATDAGEEAEPLATPDEIRRVYSMMGRRSSPAKKAAVAQNGQKGGRPQTPLSEIPCTCGAGDSIEGHKTTCPRGLAIYRRKRPSTI
jgi:hypothetical protein